MANYLVTGGAGFIGSHLVTALVGRGETVRVLDNLSSGRLENLAHVKDKIELIEGDAADFATVNQVVKGVDVVFHQAALASVPASLREPVVSHQACATATVNVLTAAQRAGVRRVVFAASSACYGDAPAAVKRETDQLDPLSPYAAAKIASEYYCKSFGKSFGLETVCLRYFNVYGPRQDPASEYSAVIPIFVSRMLRGDQPTIFGDGQQSRDFVYVEDVVAANLLAAERTEPVGHSINIGAGHRATLLDLVSAINQAMGSDLAPQFAPPRAGDVRDSMADISLARKLLGYEPRFTLEEGLVRSIDYYRSLANAR